LHSSIKVKFKTKKAAEEAKKKKINKQVFFFKKDSPYSPLQTPLTLELTSITPAFLRLPDIR
jgi:hypothetical protein